MRIICSAATIVALATLLTACGEQTTPSEAGPEPTSTSSEPSPVATSAAWAGDVIPDGTYTKSQTMAHAYALGMSEKQVRKYVGRDGKFRVVLKIDGDNYAQFSDDGDAPMAQGDGGTFTYDADGNWVATSHSTGCPGCVATVDWSLKGDQLTLTLLDTTEVGDPVDLLIGRLVMEGTWTRQ